VLFLLADTSVWLDLAKAIDGQKLIVTVRVLAHGHRQAALTELDNLAHRLPLINQMATRNFEDVRDLLANGCELAATQDEYERVVRRGLEKRAPFHRGRNSAADALLLGEGAP
jgi:hypothetical protein